MTTPPINLEQIKIAAPCDANWNDMTGDERSRACSLCKKNVYNISAMSRSEAESLIRQKEGDLCVRLFKRADGTVIVDNCPVGLRAIRKRLRWMGAGVAAALTFLGGAAFAAISEGSAGRHGAPLKQWLFPQTPEPPQQTMMTGMMVAPARIQSPGSKN